MDHGRRVMRWRTSTRPNGDREGGKRETVWGWDMVSAIAAILGLGLTILVGGFAAWTSLNREVAEIRATQAAALNDLPDKIAAAIAANARAEGNVPRDEWQTDKNAQDVAVSRLDKKLDQLIDRQYRTNHLLEQMPGSGK